MEITHRNEIMLVGRASRCLEVAPRTVDFIEFEVHRLGRSMFEGRNYLLANLILKLFSSSPSPHLSDADDGIPLSLLSSKKLLFICLFPSFCLFPIFAVGRPDPVCGTPTSSLVDNVSRVEPLHSGPQGFFHGKTAI